MNIALIIICFIAVIVALTHYRRIGKYEDNVRKILKMNAHNDSFDWTTMKDFYDMKLSPCAAAIEMIKANEYESTN